MYYKTRILTIFAAIAFVCSFAQGSSLIVAEGTRLPKDSVAAQQLIRSLDQFLSLKDGPNEANNYADPGCYMETSALLDELKQIEQNEKLHDSNFYKTYLQNIVFIDSTTYLIQLASMGVANGTPVLRAGFELIAGRKGGQFYFSSPLRRNTLLWKTKTIGNFTFHYQYDASLPVAAGYEKNAATFDKKLLVKNQTELYLCDNFPEALQALGVTYKSDYNGYAHNMLVSRAPHKTLLIRAAAPAEQFDPHDEWHERLHNALPVTAINKPVDEGCAYLYGGSWGLGWQQILTQFKTKIATDPNADWLKLYESFHNFADSGKEYLAVTYVINALIVQQLEKQKGSAAVLELLGCGKYEKSNENYFKALEKLAGINRANFNEKVWALVKGA